MSVPIHRVMTERDPREPHRASTPLELFFDLAMVVAVAAAAASLHHGIAEGHVLTGLVGYVSVFFGIWWAWVNFTWFASAFDTDDLLMRVMTMVQMAGVLVLAAGVPLASEGDFRITTLGYAIMRVALVFQWLRAARESGDRDGMCHRYALGVFLVQVLWIARLALPSAPAVQWTAFVLLMIAELLVPVWAERSRSGTPWHPEHIAERYSLFVIIVCGEVILSVSNTFAAAVEGGLTVQLVEVGVGALLIVFTMWSFYFHRSHAEDLADQGPWVWAYLHFFIFAAVAATGAGIGVMVDLAQHEAHLPLIGGDLVLAVAVALFLVMLGISSYTLNHYLHELLVTVAIAALVLLVGVLGRSPGTTTLGIGMVLLTALVVNAIVAARLWGDDAESVESAG